MNARVSCWSVMFLAWAATFVGPSGCKTDEDMPPDADPAVPCHELAAAKCRRYVACDPVVARQAFGNVETCTERENLACLASVGTGWTAGKVEQCAANIKISTNCNERINWMPGCEIGAGKLPLGARCDADAQCASLHCQMDIDRSPDGGWWAPVCGVCMSPVAPPRCGEAASCLAPQVCAYDRNEAREHCIQPQPEGEPCVSAEGCEDGLFCQRPPAATGTWVCSKQGGAGAACSDHNGCHIRAGLRCIMGVCNMPTFVADGAVCDFAGRICDDGALCTYPTPIPTPPTPPGTPTCRPFLDDGSPCNDANLIDCRPPALCRGGKCLLPGDPQCRR